MTRVVCQQFAPQIADLPANLIPTEWASFKSLELSDQTASRSYRPLHERNFESSTRAS
jgi:hypothetical protein